MYDSRNIREIPARSLCRSFGAPARRVFADPARSVPHLLPKLRRAQRPWPGNVASQGCCRHCSWSGLRPSPPHSAGSATCSPGKRRRVRWRRTSPSAPTLLILVRRSARSGRMQASGASSLPSAPRVVDRPDSEPAQPGACRARLRQPGQRAVAPRPTLLTVARRPLQVSASPTMGGWRRTA